MGAGGDFFTPSQTQQDTAADNPPNVTKFGLPSFLTSGYNTGNGSITPATYLLGFVAILVILKLVGDDNRSGIKPAHIYISWYNGLVIGLTAIIGIVFAKIVFNKWQVPGLTDVINAA